VVPGEEPLDGESRYPAFFEKHREDLLAEEALCLFCLADQSGARNVTYEGSYHGGLDLTPLQPYLKVVVLDGMQKVVAESPLSENLDFSFPRAGSWYQQLTWRNQDEVFSRAEGAGPGPSKAEPV